MARPVRGTLKGETDENNPLYKFFDILLWLIVLGVIIMGGGLLLIIILARFIR